MRIILNTLIGSLLVAAFVIATGGAGWMIVELMR